MFSVFYVWSKSLTINNDDFSAGWPFSTDDATIRHYDYSYANFDRPHNFVLNAMYHTPRVKDGVTGMVANDWQISGVYRFTSGRPYGIGYNIPGISNINLTGSDYGARVVVTCNPGKGLIVWLERQAGDELQCARDTARVTAYAIASSREQVPSPNGARVDLPFWLRARICEGTSNPRLSRVVAEDVGFDVIDGPYLW